MPPVNAGEGVISLDQDQIGFDLLLDQSKIESAINELLCIAQKIERMEPWSKQAIAIREDIDRLLDQLEESRKNKLAPS